MTNEPPLVLVAAVAMLVELAGAEGATIATRVLADRRRGDLRKTRLLIKRLRAAGLVDIVLGSRGGVRLAKAPGSIPLAEVVAALTPLVTEARHARSIDVAGRHGAVGPVVLETLARADDLRIQTLASITIGDLDAEVRRRIRFQAQAIRAERRARWLSADQAVLPHRAAIQARSAVTTSGSSARPSAL